MKKSYGDGITSSIIYLSNCIKKNPIPLFYKKILFKKLSKEEEQSQNHGYGEHFDGCQMGGGVRDWVKK